MKIRNATLQDVPTLTQIRSGFDEYLTRRFEMQAKAEADFLVVEEGREIVSFVFLKYDGKLTHPEYPDIEDLFTREDKRRQGYAKALLLECERRTKERGFHKIGLAAGPDPTDPGHQLYLKLGYKHDGKESYVDGVYDGVEDWVIDMEKELINE